jgi:SAM-dependent methyltransferase
MLDAKVFFKHILDTIGDIEASRILEFDFLTLADAEGWRVRDAFGEILFRSAEARQALLAFQPPEVAVNPLSDNDFRYRIFSGLLDATLIDNLIERYRSGSRSRVLDFGCGSGRLLTYLAQFSPTNVYAACDVELAGLKYIRDLGVPADIRPIQNFPPSSFGSSSFDVIIAWSIFSHYSRTMADAWLAEFHRLLAPGGVVFLTFHPLTSVPTMRADPRPGSPSAEVLDRVEADALTAGIGFRSCYEGRFGDLGADYSNFGITVMTGKYIESAWSSKFALREIQTAVPGWQDLAVLARVPAER